MRLVMKVGNYFLYLKNRTIFVSAEKQINHAEENMHTYGIETIFHATARIKYNRIYIIESVFSTIWLKRDIY